VKQYENIHVQAGASRRTWREALEYSIERIGSGVEVVVSSCHTFGTDSFLLSHFAAPKSRDSACDLCSGCGIVPLLWFRGPNAPRQASGVDIQEQAVTQLQQSIARSGLAGRMAAVQGDLRQLKGVLPFGTLDLVTCNPPYKAEGTGLVSRSQSARVARHEVLCTLDDVCAAAEKLLRYGGRFCICQLPERLVDVLASMRAHRVEPKRIRFVQQTSASAPWLVLVEGKLGSKPFLQIEPPLLILRENGEISPEMQRVYGTYSESTLK